MTNPRVFVILTIVFFLAYSVSALCEEGQIDINSASPEELDKISQIGPARAEEMITLRPFSSVDDMIRINGIGENNINSIKSQNLACVDEEEAITEEVVNSDNSSEVNNNVIIENSLTESELRAINLNPQAIKTEENSQTDKRDYARYGLFVFVILLGLLFLAKNFAKRKYKNELA